MAVKAESQLGTLYSDYVASGQTQGRAAMSSVPLSLSLCILMERLPPPPRTLGNYGETVVPKQILSSGVLKSLQHLGGVASFRAEGVS